MTEQPWVFIAYYGMNHVIQGQGPYKRRLKNKVTGEVTFEYNIMEEDEENILAEVQT